MLAAGIAVAACSLVPLGYVLVSSARLGPGEMADFLVRPRVGELMWNTVRLLLGGVVLATAIGVGCAWLVERTVLRWRGLWHGLLVAPLAVPAFVNGYGWVSTTHAVQSYAGAVLVVSLSYFPLVYLPTVAALRRVDPGLEDVASSLGLGPAAGFVRVVLPTISPAVLGGALLVGLHLLSEYGALQLLNYPTLTTGVLDQYRTTFNGPAATLLAAVLVVFCLVLLGLELLLRGRRRVARIGSGTVREITATRYAGRLPLRLGLLAAVVLLALAVPIISLVRWLVRGTSTSLPTDELGSAIGSTLGLAVAGGLVTTLVALPVAWLAVRRRGVVTTMVERSTYITSSLPGVVVALALVTVSIRLLPALYQTVPVLLAAYAILFLPRAIVSVRSSLELAPPVLEDVARSLGSGGLGVARRVLLPLVAPGIGAALALSALAVGTELTATLLLAPTGVTTLSTGFWSRASAVEYGAAAPYALALILLSVPGAWLLARLTTSERS